MKLAFFFTADKASNITDSAVGGKKGVTQCLWVRDGLTRGMLRRVRERERERGRGNGTSRKEKNGY